MEQSPSKVVTCRKCHTIVTVNKGCPACGLVPILIDGYDFIDFGCGNGGMSEYAFTAFGGKRSLGIDNAGRKYQNHKRDFVRADVLNCDYRGKVDYVVMGHFLEHATSFLAARAILKVATEISRKFVFFTNPAWDCSPLLHANGFKFYWEEWADHYSHVTTEIVHWFCKELHFEHTVFASDFIKDASNPDIVPLNAPNGSAHYKKELGPKALIEFNPHIYKAMNGFVWPNGVIEKCKKMYKNDKHRKVYEVLS